MIEGESQMLLKVVRIEGKSKFFNKGEMDLIERLFAGNPKMIELA